MRIEEYRKMLELNTIEGFSFKLARYRSYGKNSYRKLEEYGLDKSLVERALESEVKASSLYNKCFRTLGELKRKKYQEPFLLSESQIREIYFKNASDKKSRSDSRPSKERDYYGEDSSSYDEGAEANMAEDLDYRVESALEASFEDMDFPDFY